MHILSNPLALFVTQAILIVGSSRAVAFVTRKLGQPLVVAEVIAGIMLGPSVLGFLWPGAMTALFPKGSMPALALVSQFGLLLFMFIIGLELHPKLLRGRAHQSVAISHASIVLPFALGAAGAVHWYPTLAPPGVRFSSFLLFMGVSMSITAFPVLARILVERRLLRSRVGATAISCAAVDDVTAWCILAFIVSIVRAVSLGEAVQTVVFAVLYVAGMVWIVRPLLAYLARRTRVELTQGVVVLILLCVLASSWITELIGIHALFGAFLMGAILPKEGSFATALAEKIEDVVVLLMLPLFFAYSGLRTQIGLLDSVSSWITCLAIIVLACVGKYGGSAVAARLSGFPWREASAIGILMNTRGLMELIVLNLGYDLGVISPRLFAMLVIMALVTTFMTTPLLELVYPIERLKKELVEPASSRVLVPRFTAVACVSDEATAPGLVTLAAGLAGSTSPDTRVYAVRLVQPDERASPLIAAEKEDADRDLRADRALDAALIRGQALKSEVRPLSFVSTTPAKDICEVVDVKQADVVVLGWNRAGGGLGTKARSVLDEVMATTRSDVAVLVDRGLGVAKKILVAFSGTEGDECAVRFASRIATNTGGRLTVVVVSLHEDRQSLTRLEHKARQALDLDDAHVDVIRLVDSQPRTAVLAKSRSGYDLLVMSVGAPWGVERHSFALDPDRFFEGDSCSVVLVHPGAAPRAEERDEAASGAYGGRRPVFDTLRPSA